ncbi:UNVERIFIED_CONTAM: Malate dehydrogenase, glyoxysomal [Sesamum radiatum]|uniref:malate dehydrogenase n=1 Tax=Sesamum radiatum TaxID=300843 RepID=A0AAW2RWZ3_SESRA
MEANQRIARLSAHLHPSNPQMEREHAILRRDGCRAKGGAPGFKVAILGAAGGIGQPLAMLMKMNPLVSVLHLYDVVNSPGVTADISHMDTGAVAEVLGLDPREVDVPVVGGHAGVTILPLLSQAKAGTGSATLSMVTELPFFASKVKLGRGGAEEVYQLGPLNEYERVGLEKAKKELEASIQKGVSFIRK